MIVELTNLWWIVWGKLRGYRGCPHHSIDGCGRCDDCGVWAPFFDPPKRPVKTASQLSILAVKDDAENFSAS
jgi:hypothetical protein